MKMTNPEDFADVPVPSESRQSSLSVLAVWFGFIIVVGTMATGGGLAAQVRFSDIVTGILIGNLILGIFAAVTGWIAASSGKSFYQLGEAVFGKRSMRIVGLYVPFILIGWFAIESAILGGFLGKVLDLPDFGQRALMFLAAAVMSISAYFGFKALKRLSYILLPVIFLLGVFAIFSTNLSGLEARQILPEHPLGLTYVAGIVVSTWIMGVLLNFPDVARFAKTPIKATLIGVFGILVGNVFNLMLGVIASINTGSYDPADILIGLGFIPLAIILAAANIWTTNDNNLYSATLGVTRSLRIHRHVAVIGCGLLGAVIAIFNPATIGSIFTVLLTVGITAPALGGVVLGGYFGQLLGKIKGSNPATAWLGWIVGALAGFYISGLWGILLSFAVGFVITFGRYNLQSQNVA